LFRIRGIPSPLPPVPQWYIDDISLFRILHIGLASLAHPVIGGMGDIIPTPTPTNIYPTVIYKSKHVSE